MQENTSIDLDPDLIQYNRESRRRENIDSHCMSLRKCCCFYAPTIIVLDLIMILLLIGEIILIFPDKYISLLDGEVDAYGLPKDSIDLNATSIDA
jgi:hypothetical protein